MKEKHRHPQFSDQGLVAYYKLWAGTVDGTNVFDYAQNGFAGVPAGTDIAPAYPGFKFNGTDDEIDFASGPSSVNTIIMWTNPVSTLGLEVFDLNGTDYIEFGGGFLQSFGFAGGTFIEYVDAVVTTTLPNTGWEMITVTDTVGKDASAGNMVIGNTPGAGNTYDGKIGEVMLFDRVLSPAEVKSVYELTKWRYPN